VATQTNNDQSSGSNGGFGTGDAIRAVVGAAALGYAVRSITKGTGRRHQVAGVRLPRELTNLDARQLAKRLSKLAAQVERASEDVRMASAQTKRVADKLA
jgi:hypothetical protein